MDKINETKKSKEKGKKAFFEGITLRPIKTSSGIPFKLQGLALGNGASALEILVATHVTQPTLPILRSVWKERKGGRAAPLLLVVLYNECAAICGPTGEDAPAYVGLDPGQVERICRDALDQSDRHAALRSLRDSLPAVESDLGGIRNEGFLATHELRTGVRIRSDWEYAKNKALKAISRSGHELLSCLGFQIEPYDRITSILRVGDRKVGAAIYLNRDESPELQSERFSNLSPVTYVLAIADRENLPYVVIQHGPKIRVYPSQVGVGVGRRGRTETYVECHTGLLRDKDAAFLWYLCSAEALTEGGFLEQIIEESSRFAGDLAERLRDRVYQSVVPKIAEGIVKARGIDKPSTLDLADTYEMAILVLFRLLFIAYSEDKDLLPYRWNGLYQRRSLKTKTKELLDLVDKELSFDEGDSLWDEINRLFLAVCNGNREWGVPAYNGGLFSQDSEVSRIGALLKDITLPNTIIGPALQDLLLIETSEGLGPIDFRSLGVREFGTIYEGLLESELSVADMDLSIDKKGLYRPCQKGENPLVLKGQVYLHNASGARKSSGSYFTKHFAVEHLLERALDPALKDHLTKLDSIESDAEAGENFFDFRVADIAMGSGHFLVAVIDHIEKAFSGYLSQRPLPIISSELASLHVAALNALGPLADQVEIEDTQLLRRLIARRCIYGVDINPMAVQLARLAVWIHTFVPGLPLSLLDHNLVCGNSLVGIARLSEVKEKVEEDSIGPLFPINADLMLGEAREHLKQLAKITDATTSDLRRAYKAQEEARCAISPAAALFDIVTACRIEEKSLPIDISEWKDLRKFIANSPEHMKALKLLENHKLFHYPIAFPEVFLRERAGFDVILGNPPWEKARVEEHEFWARYFPGIRGLSQRKREAVIQKHRNERLDLCNLLEKEIEDARILRQVITSGPFPGMSTGDPDLYKAFCWRFWQLVRKDGGRIGVVLPRSALSVKGSTEFRLEIFGNTDCVDVTVFLNNKRWFFEDVHPQYSIGLVALNKRIADRTPILLRGPYKSYERYRKGVVREPLVFYGENVKQWSDTASLPLLPSDESAEVFIQLRKSPRLDIKIENEWRVRPHRELDATNDKKYMDVESHDCPANFWPVYKGGSFDLWNPDTGIYYAWGNPEIILPLLLERRKRSSQNKKSVFSECSKKWILDSNTLSCLHPRIAFRDVTNRTNRRTVICSLIPPKVFVNHKAPYMVFPRGTKTDIIFLLGCLSSIPLDWYARRYVETSLTYFVLNPFPIPRPRPKNDNQLKKRILELVGRLACSDIRFAEWAATIGVKYNNLTEDLKEDMIHELDAVVSHLYGLNEKHLIHIFETFHEGWDYEKRLKATLKHFQDWRNRL